jgi:NADPH-dependent curcumin reductase CurA
MAASPHVDLFAMNLSTLNRQWIYAARPESALGQEHFEFRQVAVPQPAAGEVLVRVRAISVDPAQRAWMKAPSYRPMLQPGEVMAAYGLAEVIESNTDVLKPGDIVEGDFGWQDYAAVPATEVVRRDAGRPLEQLIGVLNITGLTAYFGLFDIGRPRPGETVVVSAAAGAVGCIAVQLARLAGCRVVGVAGGTDKCRWISERLGADAVVDYKAGDLRRALAAACPNGVDVYFDNTGGEILEAALGLMNLCGRVVCCGAVAQYDQGAAATGLPGMPGVLIRKRLRMEGFIVFDHYQRRPAAEAALVALLEAGRLVAPVETVPGLEGAPQALLDLLRGRNAGKMMISLP